MQKKCFGISLMLTVLLFICTASTKSANPPSKSSKTFVLVHGAWQAPFVWNEVKTRLESRGNKVIVVELPAHGNDTTSPANVTMQLYVNTVVDAINKIGKKVILVGHSMGGVVVTAAAEMVPSRIEKLVYIGAFLPANQQSLADLAATDRQSHLGPALMPADGGLLLDIKHDSITGIFCQDGTAAQKQLVLDNFKPEPAIPFGNAVTITAANFGSVNKYYIHTLLDNAIGLELQNRMAAAARITRQFSLKTGHCPFITDVDGTVQLLMQIAAD